MGADFVSLTPSTSTHVCYSTVTEIRGRLVAMLDESLGRMFSIQTYSHVMKEVENIVDASGDDIAQGVYYLLDHSDCDGEFDSEQSRCIALALKKLDEIEGHEDCRIANLIKVFDDAYIEGGIVVIW